VSCGPGLLRQLRHAWNRFGRDCAKLAGLIEGTDFLIELRYAENGLQQLPELVAELVRMKVDVISPAGDFALRVAQEGASTIPIVANSDDMLGMGLVPSLARPGGNTTGLTILSPELSAKRLQLLRDFMPGLSRVASLWDPETGASQVTQTESAAQSMRVKLQILEVRRSEDLLVAFETAKRGAAEAVNVFASPFLASLYREIIDLASRYRLPAIYQWKEHAEAGGLLSYGPSLARMWWQTGIAALKLGLLEHGWIEGRNLEVIYRWGGNDTGKMRAYAIELVALNPDAIFAAPSAALAEVQRATRTIPIVFAQVRSLILSALDSSLVSRIQE